VQEILKRTRKDEKKDGDESKNGGDSPTNGEVEPELSENGVTNGHAKYNGLNGEGANHHRDMKNFVNENEQSLPPTNGF